MKKRCCFNWVGLLNPVGLLIWWWARDINMQSDLMQCKLGPVCMTVMSLSQQYAGKGTCKSVRYPVHVYLFFCTHSTCSMVLTPVLFVDSREWACCHFDTSSLWWLTSPSAHILFESGKVMPSWDMLNFNTYSIKHLNMSCHPKGRTRSHVVDFFSDQQKPAIEFWQHPHCVFYHSCSSCCPKHLHPSQPKATSEVTKSFLQNFSTSLFSANL